MIRSLVAIAVVGAHAAVFVALAAHAGGDPLAVELVAPRASPTSQLVLVGKLPAAIADRVAVTDDGGPGLRRRTWSVAYRGGFERSVYAAQLTGPYQEPAARACTGRVVVTQRLLDDGKASPSTVAGQILKVLQHELRGEQVWPAGSFQRISHLAVTWARLEKHMADLATVGAAPWGYVRVTLTVAFERVSVPIVIALIPTMQRSATAGLTFRIASRATLAFDNRIVQWVSNKLGGAALATKLAREQIDGLLVSTLAPPPPFDLGDQLLQFLYCDEPPEIVDGAYGALPFAVAFERAGTLAPPRRGRAPHGPPAADAELAIDLDLDALNAVLFELWRGGFLDRQLAAAGLAARFNTDPTVAALLSLRVTSPRLALPPVLAPGGTRDQLRLFADARVTISDDTARTTGRIWGGLAFTFAPTAVTPTAVDLDALALTCERQPHTLVPCYSDLVATMRDRAPEFHGALTEAFATLVADIFVERRLGASGLPADLVIRSAVPRVTSSADNASLHLDLRASLVAPAQ